jgi:hypothetical protein
VYFAAPTLFYKDTAGRKFKLRLVNGHKYKGDRRLVGEGGGLRELGGGGVNCQGNFRIPSVIYCNLTKPLLQMDTYSKYVGTPVGLIINHPPCFIITNCGEKNNVLYVTCLIKSAFI